MKGTGIPIKSVAACGSIKHEKWNTIYIFLMFSLLWYTAVAVLSIAVCVSVRELGFNSWLWSLQA